MTLGDSPSVDGHLVSQEEVFAKDRDYLMRFRKITNPDSQIESLLKQNDEGIDSTLKAYSAKQARGGTYPVAARRHVEGGLP